MRRNADLAGARRLALAGAVALLLALPASARAAAGALDQGFGNGGFTIIDDPAFPNEGLEDVEILPGGAILGGGHRGGARGFLLARLDADGVPDASFGSGGVSVQPDNGVGDPRTIHALDVDSAGRIVAGGFAHGSTTDVAGFGRYVLPGVTPDASFDGNGLAAVECGPSINCETFDVAAAPGGAVVGAGQFLNVMADSTTASAIRLTEAGMPDTTFNGTGIKPIDVPGADEQASSVAALGDGSLILGGRSSGGAFLARLDPTGQLETSFGSGGIAVHDLGTNPMPGGQIWDLEVLGNGRIVAVGEAEKPPADVEIVVARFLANGSLDPSFATGGIFRLNPSPLDDAGFALAIDGGGRIVVAGTRSITEPDLATLIMRLTPDGQLDPAFGSGGVTSVNAVAGGEAGAGVALQPDGGAVVAGSAERPGGAQLFFGRFSGDPSCAGETPTLAAPPSGGKLQGTPQDDVIAGSQEADRIDAGRGDDIVCGLGEGDRIKGGAGEDKLKGGRGKDLLKGGPSDDLLVGGAKRDRCDGGPGDDTERRC